MTPIGTRSGSSAAVRVGGSRKRAAAGMVDVYPSLRRRFTALLVALGVVLAVGACGGEGADLEGRSFTSTEVRGHELVEGSTIMLTFEDGRISAQAGCNTLNGGATWDGDTLEVAEPMAMTMMACEEPLMAQDQWLSEFLTSSPALDVDGDTLTLGDDATGMTLTEQGS